MKDKPPIAEIWEGLGALWKWQFDVTEDDTALEYDFAGHTAKLQFRTSAAATTVSFDASTYVALTTGKVVVDITALDEATIEAALPAGRYVGDLCIKSTSGWEVWFSILLTIGQRISR
jgi:hypothetical protein